MGFIDLKLTNPAAGLVSPWHAVRPPVPLSVSAPQTAAPTAHTLVPESRYVAAPKPSLIDDPAGALVFGTLATVTMAESFKYFILQKGKPKTKAPSTTDKPKITIPAEFEPHFETLEGLFSQLDQNRSNPERRFELVQKIAKEVMKQMPVAQKALAAADSPERRLAVLKAIGQDFEMMYRLNQTVWQARHTPGFLADFKEFKKFYFASDDNVLKRVPQMAHSLHNVVQTFFWSTAILTGFDASFATLHEAFPSLFFDFTPDYAYLDLKPLLDKLIEFATVGVLYNWLVYYGRDGFYTMNAKGPVAKAANVAVDVAGSVLSLGGLLTSAVELVDTQARETLGPGWEPFANGVRVWYTEGLFGFSKFVKYESVKHGEDIATALEFFFGSLSTLIQFIIFRSHPDLAFTEKFAKAFSNLPELIAKQVAPAAVFNWIRARAQTKISQNPKNDTVSSQIYRMTNGVFSGALFNAMNKHLADIALPLFVLNQIILGRLTHVFTDTVNNEGVRDWASLTWEKLKKSLTRS